MSTRQELQLMLRAARLYYENDLTQQQVADELGVSRSTVSRLLTQARRERIVQIAINDPFARLEDLEARLVGTFNLRQAVVVAGEGLSGDLLRRRLGLAAAEYLQSILGDGNLVGIGWGRTLHAVTEALDTGQRAAIKVLPLIGGLGQISPAFQVNDLARRLAEAFGGTWQPFYVPALVTNSTALEGLLQLPDVESVIRTWPKLDVALVGIGHFALHRQSSMLFASYMNDEMFEELERRGAVGDLCGRFFDVYGQECLSEPGVMGISLKQLKALDNVIGVAGGEGKVAAILGALRGGYPNVLVTDSVAAKAMLERHEADIRDPQSAIGNAQPTH